MARNTPIFCPKFHLLLPSACRRAKMTHGNSRPLHRRGSSSCASLDASGGLGERRTVLPADGGPSVGGGGVRSTKPAPSSSNGEERVVFTSTGTSDSCGLAGDDGDDMTEKPTTYDNDGDGGSGEQMLRARRKYECRPEQTCVIGESTVISRRIEDLALTGKILGSCQPRAFGAPCATRWCLTRSLMR